MMQTLHILTACSRPEGLAPIARALGVPMPTVALQWHVGFDLVCAHVGGQAVKNRLLDSISISDGWVWVCDDDNLPHPAMLAALPLLLHDDTPDGYLFAQDRGPQGYHAVAAPCVGRTDIAQLLIRRDAIGTHRIPESYDGDGQWIVNLYQQRALHQVADVPTYYNAQRWQ